MKTKALSWILIIHIHVVLYRFFVNKFASETSFCDCLCIVIQVGNYLNGIGTRGVRKSFRFLLSFRLAVIQKGLRLTSKSVSKTQFPVHTKTINWLICIFSKALKVPLYFPANNRRMKGHRTWTTITVKNVKRKSDNKNVISCEITCADCVWKYMFSLIIIVVLVPYSSSLNLRKNGVDNSPFVQRQR